MKKKKWKMNRGMYLQLDWNNVVSFQLSVFSSETTFDALNRPVNIVNPDNSVIGYVYDKGGLLQKVLHGATEHITNITYNEKGQRKNIYYGNNTKTKYEYNPLNFRLIRILTTRNGGQDILQDLNYTFDAVGNITKITDDAQQTHYFNNQVIAPTGTYEYDALYRLTKATGRELTSLTAPNENDFVNNIPCPDVAGNAMQNYVHNYQYDALGNMLSDNWKDYVYDTVTNRLLKHDTQQNTNDYTYDQHGNMITMPHLNTLNWDYKDQLISASNGTFTSYYNYDVQGNRTRKVVEKGNVKEEKYYVNGYEIYRKYTNNTLDFERKTLNISDDEKVFVRIEQKTNENEVVRYQYDNHLGSACLELDETGQIISYEEYHPFGTTSYRSGRSETEVSLKRYKYNGKERDEETGLYAYGMRYYAAWICRFVSVDPLQFEYPYYTPYQYAGNKPISYIDLDGGEEKISAKVAEKEQKKVQKKLNEKIRTPLNTLEEQMASSTDIKAAADSLAEKYQNRKWFRTFFTRDVTTDDRIKTVVPRKEKKIKDVKSQTTVSKATSWHNKPYITINPYTTQTQTYDSEVERPDTTGFINRGSTNLIATPESTVSIKFSPFGIENAITVYSNNSEGVSTEILKTEMFANDVLERNILMEETDESIAGEITYEVTNTRETKFGDNWRLEVSVSTPVFDTTKEIRRQQQIIEQRPNKFLLYRKKGRK